MLLAHLHLLEMALYPFAIFLENFCCVVETPLRPRDGRLDQPLRRLQEGAAPCLHAVYAGQAEQRQFVVASDTPAEYVLGAIVVLLRVALKEVLLGVLEPPAIHRAPELAVPPDNLVEAAARFVLDRIQIRADVLDRLAEGVAVWETDQRECPGAVSDTLPARKFPMCVREGSEVLYGAHFRKVREWPSFYSSRAALRWFSAAALFERSLGRARVRNGRVHSRRWLD